MKKVSIIGCGKVGKTIGYLLAKKANCDIKGILNKSFSSSKSAIKFIGMGYACKNYKELIRSNLWLISTQDSLISNVCQTLVNHEKLSRGDIVIHFSGTLNSGALYSAKEMGCFIGSLHPIKSFADPKISVSTFKGTYCAYEGDKQAFSVIKRLCKKIGAKIFKINRKTKSSYHIGNIFASNYLISLLKISYNLYYRSGVKKEYILDIIHSLSSSTLTNIKKCRSLDMSITGPIQRGDINIIKNHINFLKSTPSLLVLYRILGLKLISNQYNKNIEKLLSFNKNLLKTFDIK
ncbi:MAG: DUF2520 domain-containing protein [Wolbachia endosymbiont of Menacanthus eurysternus]|nr:MAG: DUF2520 domain-containing protein [Wolbachia endosymbiont of Menacanthus eurysternus]